MLGVIPGEKKLSFGCYTRGFLSLKHATACVKRVRIMYHSTIKIKMDEIESEPSETCSESSRQKTDATPIDSECVLLPNYLLASSKTLERFNLDDEFE